MSGRSLVHGRRLATVRWFANGWHEPYESRGSRTDLWGTGGEIPPVYPAGQKQTFDLGDRLELTLMVVRLGERYASFYGLNKRCQLGFAPAVAGGKPTESDRRSGQIDLSRVDFA